MQLRYEQLTTHLQKKLAPIYLLSGDEPLFMKEGNDAIRDTAKKQGYVDRQSFHVENNFLWQNFSIASHSFTLFSNKELLELHLSNPSLNEPGKKALQNYLANPPNDKILLITCNKLDAKTQQTAWIKAIQQIGIHIQVWPLENAQLPQWITQRLSRFGLKAEPSGIQMLAAYAEGNLSACAQEIEKFHLLYSNETLSTETIRNAIADNARFDVFMLGDAALQGDAKRVLRILTKLQQEGVEPILILWALTRELRTLASLSHLQAQKQPLDMIFQQHRVWEKRKPLFREALRRHTTTTWRALIKMAAHLDRMIKGVETGNIWRELQRLGLAMTGVQLL